MMARYLRSLVGALSLGPLLLTLSACGGTGDGGTGDPPSTPNADPLGDGARLVDVLGPATWLDPANMTSVDCAIPSDRPVHLTGQTIIAIDDYDETSTGSVGNFYIQDSRPDPVPYSGITVFDPAFTPPDLRLTEGDVVDTVGSLQEFGGPSSSPFEGCQSLPELLGTMTFRFENGPRVPLTIIPAAGGPERFAALSSYEAARPYLGMLVRIEGITIGDAPYESSSGRYTVRFALGPEVMQDAMPEISNELFDLKGEGPPLAEGVTVTSVTGILTYFYAFRIAPRSAEDIQL